VRRLLVFCALLLAIAGFALLTFGAIREQGFNVFSAISLFILLMLAVGVIGALRNPPRG
jgi:hypothetical protein